MAQNSQAIGRLRQSFVHCPITALAFYTSAAGEQQQEQQYILACEDAWLKIYPVESPSVLRAQLRVFDQQSIHGLSVSSPSSSSSSPSSAGSLLVWGAQSVTVIPRGTVEALIAGRPLEAGVRVPVEVQAPDWIYDGSLSPFDEGRGVLITAHNEVVPFRVEEASGKVVFGSLVSPSRPILYSAAVEWTSPGCVLVAAGTVFGEIVVWRCRLTGGRDAQAEVMYVFTGHEGSIFGVAISPILDIASGEKMRFLASCSDDRTIRIWDITERADGAGKPTASSEPKRTFDEARETGFGDNSNSETVTIAQEAESARRCVAVGMAHASRIWHVKFAAEPGEIRSFGEDTTVQSWRLRMDENDHSWILDKGSATGCHSGKHIWSAAVASNGSGRSLVATGGADGKVTLLGVQAAGEKTQQEIFNGTVESQLLPLMPFSNGVPAAPQGASPSSPGSKNEGFLRYAFVSGENLLISTTSGRLLLADLKAGLSSVEVDMPQETREDLKLYNVVKTVAPGTAVLGSTSGRLYLFRQTSSTFPQTCEFEELARLPGKITDILPFSSSPEGSVKILVTVLGSPEATVFSLDTRQGATNLIVSRQPVPLHKGFITTSAALCGEFLVLGSRKGIVTVYRDTPEAGYVQQTHRLDCKTKGGDAVTSIAVLPPLPGSTPRYFLTTCRDGKIRIYEVVVVKSSSSSSSNSGDVVLELRHETTPPLGPMLEGARFFHPADGGDPELMVYGFRSTSFVAWNETRQVQVASQGCGGAHRTFDYFASPTDADVLRLVYTKASAMSVYAQDRAGLQVAKPGGHGREIRSVAGCGEYGYIATGAEDTCIRIWERPGGGVDQQPIRNMRCLAVLQKHTAGIQALRWFGPERLLSSAGGEEFFVWKVTRLDSAYKGLAVVFEAAYPDRTRDGDLRITDFDVSVPRGEEEEEGMVLTLAFSNSTVKTYRYRKEAGFGLLCEGRYTGACLTQVRHLRTAAGGLVVLTASTDGFVAVWKEEGGGEGGYVRVLTSRVHQSSVKSLDIRSSEGTRWDVFTGGDDNGLGVLSLEWDVARDGCVVTSKCRVKDGHAAAITGVGIVREDGPRVYLASVSNDQRLKIWRVETRGPGREARVALVENQYSALADPGGLEMISPGTLMVGGVGMEIWSLE